MQNAAHAYLQTQVGTTGQGEIVVMLFDGALRFLAQAREKMLAKDYAGKGLLISRALDIVNELDSSLNMELGGELAKNLHQLYFLCTTRLLQANLKLDMAKLDSVVDILTGLRGAFAQVVSTPEAQAACAQLGAKLGVQPTSSPRTVAAAPAAPSFMPRAAAAGFYNLQDVMTHAAPPPPPTSAPRSAAFAATSPPATAKPVQAAQAAPQAPAAPASPVAPEAAPRPAAGFASKRLSLYGKMTQTR